jgi:hypothetical protein
MLFTDDEDREEAVSWITSEVSHAESEMEGRRKKWDRWRRQREALPEYERKNFPGSNRVSSNVVPPISMSNTNTVYANLNNMFGAIHPFWTISPVKEDNPEDLEISKILTKYFDILSESRNDLDRKKRSKTVHYETGSLGFCAVKVPWTRREWIITETEPGTGIMADSTVKLHEGPEIVAIPAEDFLTREAYQDIQTAPWVACVLHKTWPEIQQLGEQGFYEGVDELEKWARIRPSDSEESQQAREGGMQLNDSGIWDLHEVYFFWEIEGRWRDCVVTVELNSGLVLREGYNELGWRPIEGFEFLLRPFRREGIGVGHMTDHMQEEGTMIHNARIDAIHASVIPMFSARKNSGPKADEPIYPAKIWMLDDPSRDLSVIKLPEPGMISLQAEQMSLMYAQKATGMGDAQGGFADSTVKTRDSPGLMQMRIKQGSGVFGSVSEGIEDSWGMIGYLILLQLIHHKDEVIANEREISRLADGELLTLEQALSIPKAQIPIRLRFAVRTSDVEQTFEMKRQNLLTRTQLSSMYFEQTFPVVQMLFGPQGQMMMQAAPEMWKYMARIYTARSRMMEEAMKFFGEEDTGKYVPEYKKLEAMLDLQKMLSESQQAMRGGPLGQITGSQEPLPGTAATGAAPGPAFTGGGGPSPAEAGLASAGGGAGGAAPEPGMGGAF